MENILFMNINPPSLLPLNEFNDIFLNFDRSGNEWIIDDTSAVSSSIESSNVPRQTDNSAELWLLHICSNYVSNNESIFTSTELAKETLSLYKYSKSQKDSETHFQDKMFQLLGETCFEFLGELLTKFDLLKAITNESLVDTNTARNKPHTLPSSTSSSESSSSASQMQGQQQLQQEDYLRSLGFSEEYLYNERLLGLQKGKVPVYTDMAENLNHWKDDLAPEGTLVYHEKKGLPQGSEKHVGPGYEQVFIPASVNKPIIPPGGLVVVKELEEWVQQAFEGTKTLNAIQSIVYDAAFNTSQNLLICAPTGAGKTNIAMLGFLQIVKEHIYDNTYVDRQAIKVIYIAPMKALAQEVVSKFSSRLKPLGLVVKEYTGDMQLTKQEVMDSQLIVTTPEKYDVITRKGGEGSLGTLVQCILIDEVHLLADERGAVIETIVARTHRYIESSQKRIRLIGLSATLPNYEDVAKFLHVNLKTGLFHFGPEYRPVPLSQTFIGITEKAKKRRDDLMNKHCYEVMVHALEKEKQVMIFVHSRKETSKTAQAMIELFSMFSQSGGLLNNAEHEQYGLWKKQVDKSRSTEVINLFYKGFGIHHAGMSRSDRNLTEDLFQYGLIKVLCCTATLAWGVNLPAHTVIIKGTELYQPERGGFVDLSILDVLQIFGRAGRPQYDTTGHAVLITPHKSLDKYLSLLGTQAPIESGLIKCLPDHLNAEIVNGTVNNIKEAASWLNYTFLFVRMTKNPISYGLSFDDVFEDPQLIKKRVELVTTAAQTLDRCMMSRYDPRSGNLGCTDLGRVASHYYIKCDTIEAFNSMLNPHLNDVEALHVLCSSTEFDQLKLRPEEIAEIDTLKKQIYTQNSSSSQNQKIKFNTTDDTSGKVNLLLTGYLKQIHVNSFTLQSDTNYIAQNGSRIARALFELCLKRGWSSLTAFYLELCKSIDKRINAADQSPLRQFYYDELPKDVLRRLEDPSLHITVNSLQEMTDKEVSELLRNNRFGQKVKHLCEMLPKLSLDVKVQPITRGIMRIMLELTAQFEWSDKYHGIAEPFWIWIEDGENEYVYHAEHFMLSKKQRNEVHRLDFTIPTREPLPPQYYIRVVSDRWLGCTSLHAVSFQHLILPERFTTHTDLLDMHPIPKTALNNTLYESLYTKFTHFNPIQTQVFHTLYHSDRNVLVGAPTGSGKTIMSELAILRMLNTNPTGKIIYVAPLKALARERVEDWNMKLGQGLGLSVLELTGDSTPDTALLNSANLLIVTPEKWDSISRGWRKREYVKKVALIIIDEIHLLGVERGAVLEIITSRMRFISAQYQSNIRFVGLSTALANPRDLADWMGIGQIGVYNFRPAVRPVPMTIHIQGFPGKHYCPRMATMNKPCYATILEHSPTKPTLIFVSSRRQTRLTALDLIAYCAADDNPKRFLNMAEDDILSIIETLKDDALKNTIVFGVAIHHAGLDNHDRKTVENLYVSGKILVLVATSTLAWGVNLPCHLVIVKGTEFFDGKISRYVNMDVTDILQMIGRAGRPAFDDTGVAAVFVHEPMKNFYRKFLFEPFPVESSLHKKLHEHVNAEVVSGILRCLDDVLEWLTWTYFFRRLAMNPSFYQLDDCSPAGVRAYLVGLVGKVVSELAAAGCIDVIDSSSILVNGSENGNAVAAVSSGIGSGTRSSVGGSSDTYVYESTSYGRITSFYYLDYRTLGLLTQEVHLLLAPSIKTGSSNSSSRDAAKSSSKSVSVTRALSVEHCLRVLCQAREFSEIPVRHNEDLLNQQLSQSTPWPVDEQTFDSSNTKAYLLIQAYLYNAPLPILDYINDTKTVFDQVPRVLNAFIDAMAETATDRRGSGSDYCQLSMVLQLMKVSKLIYQGMGEGDSELTQLPGLRVTSGSGSGSGGSASRDSNRGGRVKANNNININTNGGSTHTTTRSDDNDDGSAAGDREPSAEVRLLQRQGMSTLRSLADLRHPQLEALARKLFTASAAGSDSQSQQSQSQQRTVSEFLRVVKQLPVFRLASLSVTNTSDNSTHTTNYSANSSDSSSSKLSVQVAADTEYELKLTFDRVNTFGGSGSGSGGSNREGVSTGGGTTGAKAFCPKYHKPKSYSWWVLLGTCNASTSQTGTTAASEASVAGGEEVMALKRVGHITAHSMSTSLKFTTPAATAASTTGSNSSNSSNRTKTPTGAGVVAAAGTVIQSCSLYLICDCIFGLDLTYTIDLVVQHSSS